jgi:ribosomal protein L9
VTSSDVVEAVSKAGGPKLDRRLITLARRSRRSAATRSPSRCTPEVEATLTLEVVAAK